MKKIVALALCVLLAVCLLAACAEEEAVADDSAKFIGKWSSTDLLNDSYEFNDDGTGYYDNFLFPYDFKWELKDGKLLIYAELLGTVSDTATEYSYSFSGNELTLTDENGSSLTYKK